MRHARLFMAYCAVWAVGLFVYGYRVDDPGAWPMFLIVAGLYASHLGSEVPLATR